MNIPDSIRVSIRDALWRMLDELDWRSMSDTDHTIYYERWTKAADIGGKLSHFMDPRAVRVYIKDTLVKEYARDRLLNNVTSVLSLLRIPTDSQVAHKFTKPHGLLLSDGRIVCWGNSRDWKHLLMAAFERGRSQCSSLSAAVVIIETGKTSDCEARELVSDAANRLGIDPILWWD